MLMQHATFFYAGGSWSNRVQHNTVHRNLVPRPAAPKDPCLPQVPPRFPGLLHLYHQRFVIDWRLHIYSRIKAGEMGKHNNQLYGFLGLGCWMKLTFREFLDIISSTNLLAEISFANR